MLDRIECTGRKDLELDLISFVGYLRLLLRYHTCIETE